MGKEINLLKNYPKTKRNLEERAQNKSEEDRKIARKFDREFFDGDRKHGYGGFKYHSKFWEPVIPTFRDYWDLGNTNKTVLDIGCGKGFMVYDLIRLISNLEVKGIDISEYAINNCKDEVSDFLSVADAKELPFEDKSFDVVISINTIHNLDIDNCAKALREINRVSKKHSFVTVDAFRNEEEEKRMLRWNLTAKTIMSVSDWEVFFKKNNYKGDYFWFIP